VRQGRKCQTHRKHLAGGEATAICVVARAPVRCSAAPSIWRVSEQAWDEGTRPGALGGACELWADRSL